MALPQSVDEKLSAAEELKSTGNDFFRQQEYVKACQSYTRIFAYINGLDTEEMQDRLPQLAGQAFSAGEVLTAEQKDRIRQLKLSANANLAMAFLKREKYSKAQKFATSALELDPMHVKSLFRRGQAYLALEDLDAAKEDFDTVEELDPENKALPRERKKLQTKYKEHRKKEQAAYRNLFARRAEDDEAQCEDVKVTGDGEVEVVVDDSAAENGAAGGAVEEKMSVAE